MQMPQYKAKKCHEDRSTDLVSFRNLNHRYYLLGQSATGQAAGHTSPGGVPDAQV